MKKGILLCLLILLAVVLSAEARQEAAAEIAEHIAEYIEADLPIFLELRCGEWTPALANSLSERLLAKGADLRELPKAQGFHDSEQYPESDVLQNYGIKEAKLVQVELNLIWKTVEHKSFFSYRTERLPVYSFAVKQLLLPQRKLIQVNTYDYSLSGSKDSSISAPRLRWFEPLIAGAALASIVFLLWTIE